MRSPMHAQLAVLALAFLPSLVGCVAEHADFEAVSMKPGQAHQWSIFVGAAEARFAEARGRAKRSRRASFPCMMSEGVVASTADAAPG